MGWRKIEVDGQQYEYRIGKGSAVIKGQGGKKSVVGVDELTGLRHDDIDRGRYKKTGDGMITPAHIKKYIERTYDAC